MDMLMKRYEQLAELFSPADIIIKPALRVNTLRISTTELVKKLRARGVVLEPISFLPDAFYYEAPFSLAATIEYLSGLFYLQEAASQLPAQVLLEDYLLTTSKKNKTSNQLADSPCPDTQSSALSSALPNTDSPYAILDMCAAPGSKTTQLASLTFDGACIVALDENMPRVKALQSNIQRLGITSVAVFKKDARFVDDLGLLFDYVLLDAPCSGNFCIEPDFFTKRSPQDFKERASLQKELLKAAYKVLKKGGLLVYSTCSLEPEENELVMDWFLKKYADMSLEPVVLPIGDEGLTKVFGQSLDASLAKTKRFWPHKTGTQGFFIAKLKKSL